MYDGSCITVVHNGKQQLFRDISYQFHNIADRFQAFLKTAQNYFLDRFFQTYSVQQFGRKIYIFQVTNL